MFRWFTPQYLRFDRYDVDARRVLWFAREAATEVGGKEIQPEHILLGLLKSSPEIVGPFLRDRASADRLRDELVRVTASPEHVPAHIELPFAKALRPVLKTAMEEAHGRRLTALHLLLGLFTEGTATAEILRTHGVERQSVSNAASGRSS